jgi:hypothetical protein
LIGNAELGQIGEHAIALPFHLRAERIAEVSADPEYYRRRADIPGNAIGKIRIENQKSFVDVPGVLVSQVMKQVGKYKIRKQVVNVTLG